MRLSQLLRIAAGGATNIAPPLDTKALGGDGKDIEELLKPLGDVFKEKEEKDEPPGKKIYEEMKRKKQEEAREQEKETEQEKKKQEQEAKEQAKKKPPSPRPENEPGKPTSPEAYKKEHGRCPDGWQQDDRGRCKRS